MLNNLLDCPIWVSPAPQGSVFLLPPVKQLLSGLLVIKDWSVQAPYSHLAGGMKYHDGKLIVPTSGRYNIYAQLYYHNNGRVYISVNHKPITMIQPPTSGKDHGTLYAGGVYSLKAGDVITLSVATYPVPDAKLFMWSLHCYFGAYLIWANWCKIATDCTITS